MGGMTSRRTRRVQNGVLTSSVTTKSSSAPGGVGSVTRELLGMSSVGTNDALMFGLSGASGFRVAVFSFCFFFFIDSRFCVPDAVVDCLRANACCSSLVVSGAVFSLLELMLVGRLRPKRSMVYGDVVFLVLPQERRFLSSPISCPMIPPPSFSASTVSFSCILTASSGAVASKQTISALPKLLRELSLWAVSGATVVGSPRGTSTALTSSTSGASTSCVAVSGYVASSSTTTRTSTVLNITILTAAGRVSTTREGDGHGVGRSKLVTEPDDVEEVEDGEDEYLSRGMREEPERGVLEGVNVPAELRPTKTGMRERAPGCLGLLSLSTVESTLKFFRGGF
ncbi:hypothetical protein C8R46DRAFT_1076803 [Mycena filopes]|nr:hypothetical protein C8R46DRAFT_1076803 [Mycena filopes]